MKLNGTHQLLSRADNMNLLGDITDTVKKSTQTLSDISMEVGLEVNTDKTKYTSLSHHQNAGQNHYIKTLTNLLKMWFTSNNFGD
jgi:hypothetical protein